jgi:hypothetical protein
MQPPRPLPGADVELHTIGPRDRTRFAPSHTDAPWRAGRPGAPPGFFWGMCYGSLGGVLGWVLIFCLVYWLVS